MNKQLSFIPRNLFLALFLIMGGIFSLNAKTVTVDGIKYKYSKKSDYLIVVKAAYSGDIKIPETAKGLPVKEVGSSAFSELDDLKSVTLSNSIEKIGDYAFDSSVNLEKVVLGNSLKNIGHWSFRNCYKLEEVRFPKSLETIGNYCFDKNLKVTKVTIPENVTLIGGYAFEGNPQLTVVYSLSATPPEIKKGYLNGEEIYTIFDDNEYGERILYVPKGTVNDYKLTFGWNHFKYIEEIVPSSLNANVVDARFNVYSDGEGQLVVVSEKSINLNVYDISGKLLLTKNINAGMTRFTISSGPVIVNGKKIMIK